MASAECPCTVRVVQNRVIETVFSGTLPPEGNERRREQDRRRKFKEKVLAEHEGDLIVDSSYVTSDGKEGQVYTNTILITKNIDWWQEKVEQRYGEKYSQTEKTLTGGHQITYSKQGGAKLLSFSFYTQRNKLMTQGGEAELKSWISIFAEIAQEEKEFVKEKADCNTNKEEKTTDACCDNVTSDDQKLSENLQDEKKLNPNISVDNQPTEAESTPTGVGDVTLTDTDSILFYTPKAPVLELNDKELNPAENVKHTSNNKHFAPQSPKRKILSKYRRQSSHFIMCNKSTTSMRDSQRLLQIKGRLDSIDGIIAGLQASVLQVVDSVNDHKVQMEDAIGKLTDMSQKILEKVSSASPPEKSDNNKQGSGKELNQVKESVCQLQNTMNKKLDNITEQVKMIESDVKKTADINKHSKQDILESVNDATRKVMNNITPVDENLTLLNNKIHRATEKIEKNEAETSQISRSLTTLHASIQTSMTTTNKRATASDSSTTNIPPKTTQLPHSERTQQAAKRAETRTETSASNIRKVLLMGDSTSKNIDKRRVVRDETISKCRAATIADAHFKITTGSNENKKMQKVVFCLGLNELRDGQKDSDVLADMKRLIQETKRRHPGCEIYICSILPIRCNENMKREIKSTNKQFSELCESTDKLFYVDIISEFLHHTPMSELFEKDQIHPSVKGALVMTIHIRNRMQGNHKPRQLFTSKRADTNYVTYAESLSTGLSSDSQPRVQGLPFSASDVGKSREQYPYPTRPYWWPPPGTMYPPMMSLYPPMYQPTRETINTLRDLD